MAGFRYKAFISYSWSDRGWGEWLHRALETYRTPSALIGKETPLGPVPRTLHPIFKDREEVAAGASIGATVEEALGASEFLIVICSPRAAKSKWVNREIAWFKVYRDPAKILALIIDGEPGASAIPGREAKECFPPALVHRVNADLSVTGEREDEPLGADVRNTGDGRNLAKLKIIAAMLGVGLDELVKRDERRRSFRRRLVTGGALALAAVMSGLAYTAILARDEARFQRDEAQGLVEFMLTDLRKRLDAVGRLDVLESVGERALKYFGAQDIGSLDANALGRRARAQLLVGEIANLRGDLDGALAAYKQAAATTAEQLRRNPNSAQQIFDHAQSVFWVGYIAWQRRDVATARKYWNEYHQLAKRLVAIDPNKDEWQSELGYAYSNLGILEMDVGNAAAAETEFRSSLLIWSHLATKQPKNLDRLIEEGQQRAWLADALFLGLKFAEARSQRSTEIDLYERGLALSPGHKRIQEVTIVAHEVFARIELARNELQSALLHAKLATEIADRLIGSEPDNTKWSDFGAVAHVRQGEVLFHLGDFAQAREAALKALATGLALVKKDDKVVLWKSQIVAPSRFLLARVSAAERDTQRAQEFVRAAITVLEPLIEKNLSDHILIRRYCEALSLLSRFGSAQDNHWLEVVARLEPRRVSQDPGSLMLLSEAYVRTGRIDEARKIADRLYKAGYRHPDFLALIGNTPKLIAASNDAAPPAHPNR